MSSSDRRLFLAGAAAAAALSACGFTPVYGPKGAAEGLWGRIAVDPPRDEPGFALVRQLESRLGIAEAPEYRLEAQIALTQSQLGITSGQEITRINVQGRVRYALREIGSGRVATQGTVESFTSYSATGTPFSTQTARADARERLMVILADQIVSRLLATADGWRK